MILFLNGLNHVSRLILLLFIFLYLVPFNHLSAQKLASINSDILEHNWEATWITHTPYVAMVGVPSVCLFRKTITIENIPDNFLVHVSADNRYKFYVNGKYIGNGPARSVPAHWNFETYNLSEVLQQGENILAVRVWYYGTEFMPWGQATNGKTGLIVQGDTEAEKMVNTNSSWKATTDKSYRFKKATEEEFHHLTGVGPCEIFDASKHPGHWKRLKYDDSKWQSAATLVHGVPVKQAQSNTGWALEPRIIPQLEYEKTRVTKVRRSNLENQPVFFDGKSPITIPANSKINILLDNEFLTVAYPNIIVDKGKGSNMKLTYGEALFDKNNRKRHRDSIQNLELKGYYDQFFFNGDELQVETLWFKTFRYIQLEIETQEEPLVIKDLFFMQSLYPFKLKAEFSCSDKSLEKIFKVGWRTARLCAFENYVDCPYYEQVQYFGDQNISNFITVWLSGDARLMKSTILQAIYSKTPENLTTAAAPGSGTIIPFYSIAVIGIMHNYLQYTGDTQFIRNNIKLIDGILDWYYKKLNEKSMLGPMNHWNFVDCTSAWPWQPENGSICEPVGTKSGNSSILTLQYVYGLQLASGIYESIGGIERSEKYKLLADKISKAVLHYCWDESKKYLADTPEKQSFSQHANIFGVLTGMFDKKDSREILTRLINDKNLIQASLQYQAYFHKCLENAGLADNYIQYLSKWKELLQLGFTTFPEYPEVNCRSDCHAWSAYPAYEMFSIICGISITKPGFSAIKIEPHLGNLQWVKAKLPWKNSSIEMNLKKSGAEVEGTIKIPQGLRAEAFINGSAMQLKPGLNAIE